MLRDYQQNAHDAAVDWVRKYTEPCVLELPTGAGKSHVIAAMADTLHTISNGKHILCIQPSKELLEQNSDKYLATGNQCSLFSASVGATCLKYPVVFGTEKTIKNRIHRFGNQFCAVILDEAHRITPTIKTIIESMQEQNPRLRVIGLSATPYRLGEGYIYRQDEQGRATGHDGYFMQRVYSLSARYLIDKGYLTQPIIGAINSGHYETRHMQLNKMGKFSASDIDRAYHGRGRLTSSIVADIVAHAQTRKGVMIFAATVQHAQEVMESLPRELSAIVTGNTPKSEREAILHRFKQGALKYLVNVAVLTTGFDAPHVDLIAILRATESVALLQQIIGRGLRVSPDKKDCLVLDYAENIDRHCPDGDLFNPEIEANKRESAELTLNCICPECNHTNEFAAKINDQKLPINIHGYFLDLEGNLLATEFGPQSAHFGRRCNGWHPVKNGKFARCEYRWTFKPCPHCEAENDIAARYCCQCKGEIIDPNEKLVADFIAHKKDPTQLQTDMVISFTANEFISRAGNRCLRINFVTEYRTFDFYIVIDSNRHKKFLKLNNIIDTVTYQKKGDFFNVIAYNEKADEIPFKH